MDKIAIAGLAAKQHDTMDAGKLRFKECSGESRKLCSTFFYLQAHT